MIGFDYFFGRILAPARLRKATSRAFPWLIDAIEYGLFTGTFLAAPWVLREGAHVRVDIVVTTLPPRGAALLETLADLIGLAVCLILLWYGRSSPVPVRRTASCASSRRWGRVPSRPSPA